LENGRPVIVGVAKRYGQKALSHYEVVVGIQPNSQTLFSLDPADGWIKNSVSGFMTEWDATGHVMLVLPPAPSPSEHIGGCPTPEPCLRPRTARRSCAGRLPLEAPPSMKP